MTNLNRAFDPSSMLPRDDEEALRALERNDATLTTALQGIYQVHRAQGDLLFVAFEAALRAHLKAIEDERSQT